ncbi:unnamed protein product [Ixodes hexagonus]
MQAGSMLQLRPGVSLRVVQAPRNSKLVLVSAGVGIVLLGVLTRYLRRRYFPSTGTVANGDVRRALCAECRRPPLRQIAGAKPRLGPDDLGRLGLESLEGAIVCWRDSLDALHGDLPPPLMCPCGTSRRQGLLDVAGLDALLAEAQLLRAHCRALLAGEARPGSLASPPSAQDTDSFVSAEGSPSDVGTLSDVEQPPVPLDQCPLYLAAMELSERDAIPCRTYRLETLRCSSKQEYLAKIHCVRLAFQYLTEREAIRHWLISAGSQILGALMLCTGRDPKEALQAYDELMVYLLEAQHLEQTEKELRAKGASAPTLSVVCTTVYDVCIDYMLLDAFEDLGNPPATVVAVIQNRWLTTCFKETALAAAIWSVLKAKRSLLPVSLCKFWHWASLLLRWASLCEAASGTKSMACWAPAEVESLVQDMFDLGRTRYTTLEDMATDIFHNSQVRYDKVCQALAAAAP